MDIQNKLENKAKFFAQYWGVEVIKYDDVTKPMTVDYFDFIDMKDDLYLELKPLSSITDEDLISIVDVPEDWEIFKTYNLKKDGYSAVKIRRRYEDNDLRYNEDGFKYEIKTMNVGLASISDFLRSKGYALPWMGLSVEKLQEYGWIKLKK